MFQYLGTSVGAGEVRRHCALACLPTMAPKLALLLALLPAVAVANSPLAEVVSPLSTARLRDAAPDTNAGAPAEKWLGSLDYGSYAKGAPFNISITGATAVANWVYDTDAGGGSCTPDSEPALKVVRNATDIVLDGSGKNPDFYTFAAKLNSAGDTMTGTVWVSNTGKLAPAGASFTAKKNGPPNMKKCKAKPKPPPPPPPPPPHPTTHALIWPLPTKYTNGSVTLGVDGSKGAAFFAGAASSKLLTAAFARYAALTFGHKTAASHLATGVTGLTVTVASLAEDFPQLETDESYSLTVTAAGAATLTTKTVFGALR